MYYACRRFSLQDGRMGAGEWYRCQELVAKAIDTSKCQAVADATCPELPKQMPKLTGVHHNNFS